MYQVGDLRYVHKAGVLDVGGVRDHPSWNIGPPGDQIPVVHAGKPNISPSIQENSEKAVKD